MNNRGKVETTKVNNGIRTKNGGPGSIYDRALSLEEGYKSQGMDDSGSKNQRDNSIVRRSEDWLQ